jgi:phytoene dehydrogenase-like protein
MFKTMEATKITHCTLCMPVDDVPCAVLLASMSQVGGSEALINALIRGLEKHGGRLLLRSHVDTIHVENGRAAGVVLQPRTKGNGKSSSSSSSSGGGGQPEFIRARKGVISNASVWDTQKLLAPGVGPAEWRRQSISTPAVSD